jgi:hypothetical protein
VLRTLRVTGLDVLFAITPTLVAGITARGVHPVGQR